MCRYVILIETTKPLAKAQLVASLADLEQVLRTYVKHAVQSRPMSFNGDPFLDWHSVSCLSLLMNSQRLSVGTSEKLQLGGMIGLFQQARTIMAS